MSLQTRCRAQPCDFQPKQLVCSKEKCSNCVYNLTIFNLNPSLLRLIFPHFWFPKILANTFCRLVLNLAELLHLNMQRTEQTVTSVGLQTGCRAQPWDFQAKQLVCSKEKCSNCVYNLNNFNLYPSLLCLIFPPFLGSQTPGKLFL